MSRAAAPRVEPNRNTAQSVPEWMSPPRRARALFLALTFLAPWAAFSDGSRSGLLLDSSEAEAVLALAAEAATGKAPDESAWNGLFETVPFLRLEKRELALQRPFPRDGFRQFVLSPDLAGRALALRRTLESWRKTDLDAIAARIRPYLPATAMLRASIYPVIKPRSNSFVFEADSDPAIFLYLDPEQSPEAFANTVAHELHHIGLASLQAAYEKRIEALPANARHAARWLGALGEGLAVLAAAGSPDVHPLRDFPEADRRRWDQDMEGINQLVAQVDRFLLDVAEGGFTRPEVADRVAFTFFGYRGPWYTVGYHAGARVEKRFGRAVLLECIADPRRLLARFNEVAQQDGSAGFSPALLAAVKDER